MAVTINLAILLACVLRIRAILFKALNFWKLLYICIRQNVHIIVGMYTYTV